jgi:hypothetical protein
MINQPHLAMALGAPASSHARHRAEKRGFRLPANEEQDMNTLSPKEQQQRKISTQPGFLAALDESGGSTSKALMAYGLNENAWSNEV